MAAFKIDRFGGIYPKIPDSLLQDGAASIAENCDFAYSELRNTKGGYRVQTMANAPASLYTDDGLRFYSWEDRVHAVRSPLARDTFNRLYYTTPTDFRVTSRDGMQVGGGAPASSYRVGVPRPTIAPALSIPSIPPLDNATMTVRFHYEYGGIKYQEQDIALTEITPNELWRFDPPARDDAASNIPKGQFLATAYWVEPSGEGSDVFGQWVGVAGISDPTPATIKVISGGSIMLTGRPSNPTQMVSTTRVKDELGQIHEVESLFSLAEFAVRKPTSAEEEEQPSATPEQAFPVIRMTATDADTNEILFDIYSANSSLATNSVWSLALAREDAPATGYTVTLSSGAAEADKRTRAYVFTYANIYNEEGPPSPPATITTGALMPVEVVCTRDDLTADYAPIKEIRIYRTSDDSDIADYFYDGSIPVLTEPGAEFSFTDDVKAAGLNEPISSMDAYPPDPGLVGLMALPNGILMAWKGNELHFSEAYRPWAWPPEYVKTFTHNIVGTIAHGSGALVTTIGQPFLISGVSPDSMTDRPLSVPQAGVSPYAMADLGGAIVYASHDGIVAVEGGQATLSYSEQFFTRDVWRARCNNAMESMVFAVWDGRLIVYSSTNAFKAFMLRLDEAKGSMTDLPGFAAKCSFVSPVTDLFYYASGTGLFQFAGGCDIKATWQSREAVFPEPLNFGFAQAVCNGAWTVSFIADGVPRYTKTIAGTQSFRLPAGFKSDRWYLKISGTGRFRELRIAQSARELSLV